MKIGEIVSFRKDLLFNGAVQIGWFEKDKIQADKAAQYFIFHGPEYHGAASEDFSDSTHKLVDTATFTVDLLERLSGKVADEPFALAIAGYGTGKSHLGVTLATLLSNPASEMSQKILNNISMADKTIGSRAKEILADSKKPYLVLTINGMQDFDLTAEIVRQILLIVNSHNLDTTVLENLRPRFKTAINFTESFFESLHDDFTRAFGQEITSEEIVTRLRHQDDEIFCKVNEIFELKMSEPIRATGQESLHDFIRVTKETYCGEDKPFAGILIVFDEFGRYLEFSVQKPHIAGSGSLQKLFESVQENGDKVFLLSFIQYELKAYISRVAPEHRDDLNRYVTRFDAVRKIRLSTNLETLISNLLEKKNSNELKRHVEIAKQKSGFIQSNMKRWFPGTKHNALWLDAERFDKVIITGCWPLHPISTWIFYQLSAVGKSLQQRSALSLLADIITDHKFRELAYGETIVPADLCNESLINEFLSSERIGQQGATAHSYENVVKKYEHVLHEEQKNILKSVLLSTKTGVKINSREDYISILSMFSGLDEAATMEGLHLLEQEYAVLAWNERLRQYEIVDDAIPRSAFIRQLSARVEDIDSSTRANIFSEKLGYWLQRQVYSTDFGPQNKIPTREWNYNISYTNVQLLHGHIDYTLRSWIDAMGVDEEKGQLIYCYVGPDSNLDAVKESSIKAIQDSFQLNHLTWENGAPLSIIFLHDSSGIFGEKIAEYWVLQEQLTEEDSQKFSTFISNSIESTKQEIENLFSELERDRHIVFTTDKDIKPSRINNMLNELFDIIYPNRFPFPFDGFHTAKGNAAKDSQIFTKELFLGNLDRDWISARAAKQRSRAYFVLDEAWGAIADDGSIRLKPNQSNIKGLFEKLDKQLHETAESNKPINIGAVIRELCAPPYGCNIASSGMLLALFVGRRRGEINILKDAKAISIENWLQDAMPGNFLDISALNITSLIKVTEDAISEWERLLEEWDSEAKYIKKVLFPIKANRLNERIPVPQQLYYKYSSLIEKTNIVREELRSFDELMNDGIEKIESGQERDNLNLITWGAGILLELKYKLISENDHWAEEQTEEINVNLANAKSYIKLHFEIWLRQQMVVNIEHLSKFKHIMFDRIAPNLQKLGLNQEKEQLINHVAIIEENIRHIAEIKRTASDITGFVEQNYVANSTPVSVLNDRLSQVKILKNRLVEASNRTDLARDDIEKADSKLNTFQERCKEQINTHQERLANIYNIESIDVNEISYWKNEAKSLMAVFVGQDIDIEDLSQVIKQLDLIEKHSEALNNVTLSNDDFEGIVKSCYSETEAAFLDDDPPLDYQKIYESMVHTSRATREAKAHQWMKQNMPNLKDIEKYDSQQAISTKARLQNTPAVLTSEQVETVNSAILACDNILDNLEVEGMVARFESLSAKNKDSFIRKIAIYLKKLTG